MGDCLAGTSDLRHLVPEMSCTEGGQKLSKPVLHGVGQGDGGVFEAGGRPSMEGGGLGRAPRLHL